MRCLGCGMFGKCDVGGLGDVGRLRCAGMFTGLRDLDFQNSHIQNLLN